jgi:hypothetical protein
MRRGLSLIVALAVVVGSLGLAQAGGYHLHGNNSSAFWWVVSAGAALGTLGVLAARPYYPVAQPHPPYPPPPRTVTWLSCPVYQAYSPSVPACPMPWVQVQVPY